MSRPIPLNVHQSSPIRYYRNTQNNKQKVQEIREYIYNTISESMDNKINRLDCYRNNDIMYMIKLYDELLFGNCLLTRKDIGGDISIIEARIEERIDIKIAAQTIPRLSSENKIILILYKFWFRKSFENPVSVDTRCYDRLECIQQTIEHELIHILINLYLSDIDTEEEFEDELKNKWHGKIFINLYENIFRRKYTKGGYLEYDVDIYEGKEDFLVKQIKVGDTVKLITGDTVKIIDKPYEDPLTKEMMVRVSLEGKIKKASIYFFDFPNDKRKSRKQIPLSPISNKSTIQI